MFYLLADYIDLIWPQCNYWKTARGFADIKMNSSIEVKSIHMIGFASSFVWRGQVEVFVQHWRPRKSLYPWWHLRQVISFHSKSKSLDRFLQGSYMSLEVKFWLLGIHLPLNNTLMDDTSIKRSIVKTFLFFIFWFWWNLVML